MEEPSPAYPGGFPALAHHVGLWRRYRFQFDPLCVPRNILRLGHLQSFPDCSQRNIAVHGVGTRYRKLQFRRYLVGQFRDHRCQRSLHRARLGRQRNGDRNQHRRNNQVRFGNCVGDDSLNSSRHYFSWGKLQSFADCSQRNIAVHGVGTRYRKLQFRRYLVSQFRDHRCQRSLHRARLGRQCHGDCDQHRRHNQVR